MKELVDPLPNIEQFFSNKIFESLSNNKKVTDTLLVPLIYNILQSKQSL